MGFADLSIADIAAQYDLQVETIFHICEGLNIRYKNQATYLALEDAKMVILEILSANIVEEETTTSSFVTIDRESSTSSGAT